MSEKPKMKRVAILRKFFGYREGTGLQEFGAEIKALSKEEKIELSDLASIELGVDIDES
jgi:hypothetical protein